MNENNLDIKQKIRRKSINNAIQNGIDYQETPPWISQVSWIISAIVFLISIFISINQNKGFAVILFGSFVLSLWMKFISYLILSAIFKTCVTVKKGSCIAYKKGAEAIDSIGIAVVKKAKHITEIAKEENKIEKEKQFLKNRINDLELQKLKQRVAELEKELKNKE